MRIFVTGASGWIGSAITTELVATGHQVVGLARSDASAAVIAAAGADVLRGDVTDSASIRAGVADSDGVIHTAFNHDFSRHIEAAEADFATVQLFGELLEGTGRPLVIASGLVGGPSAEDEGMDPASSSSPRARTEQALLGFADRGVRSSSVRLAPSVHGEGDQGFVARLVAIAREKGVSGYVGDGSNVWPAVHRLDAAHLFTLALEKAPAGSVLHAADDEAVPLRRIAEVIGAQLNVPLQSVSPEDAMAHFGFLGPILGLGGRATSTLTRDLLGWAPTHPGLIADLEAGHYFRTA